MSTIAEPFGTKLGVTHGGVEVFSCEACWGAWRCVQGHNGLVAGSMPLDCSPITDFHSLNRLDWLLIKITSNKNSGQHGSSIPGFCCWLIWHCTSPFNRWHGVPTGFTYQCVELARRYLIINHGVTFESIPMAYDIFDLKNVQVLKVEISVSFISVFR